MPPEKFALSLSPTSQKNHCVTVTVCVSQAESVRSVCSVQKANHILRVRVISYMPGSSTPPPPPRDSGKHYQSLCCVAGVGEEAGSLEETTRFAPPCPPPCNSPQHRRRGHNDPTPQTHVALVGLRVDIR
eukprot:TRINITY_DN2837_c0_g1_i1.p3 TRINITY_DN2837_c0_g1~~TRINITY_DN2837_c0_g1_i1.p3  ORF type:complete len:130 (+),score=0.67 TRINITY_DN2837_c0_g1_i1:1382-1771(+)